ncbi:hypothetical protein TW85_13080 [Marinomonas sp. S3726]|uniref:hypothetical protein n=1 Tax=Marinomonas sp. S3726 TaxID=579484 RepID=UPI0005FA7AB2|nr:hypothetical protein [Marinomonas sp. S3726]KJZ13624.1 hypothetical protein TW85_13080 [Marinomonas sp. S3726]
MIHSGTPRDYSDDMYKVYFEVGEWEGRALTVLTECVGEAQAKHIKHLEFGYEFVMPIQCVPDVAKLLSQKNVAIYQIVRGAKIERMLS